MIFTEDQQQAIDNLNKYIAYFERNSKGLFEHEAFVANNIIKYINSIQTFTDDDIANIEKLYNQIKEKEHLNGSGWFDFQIRLNTLLYRFGYDARFDNQQQILTISKIQEQNTRPKKWWKFW